MITHENTLSEKERYVLGALASDPDAATARRAQVLLEWANGNTREKIAHNVGLRAGQVQQLTRAFSQKRLEVFAPSSIERAARGVGGTTNVDALLHKYHVDMAHARYVAELALKIFDETVAVHQLPPDCRRLLETGALLHNIGATAEEARHHRAGREIILSHELEGFSSIDRDVLASLALFHHKKVKAERDAIFAGLDEATQRATLILAAILRVADGLDDSQTQSTTITSIHVEALVDTVVEGPQADVDAARANKKADLWRQVLTPPFYARLANDSLPTPSPQKRAKLKTGVRGQEPITRAGKKIISAQFAKIQSLEDDVRRDNAVNAVHDMRVATRRLRSAFRFLAQYYPNKTIKKIAEPLRELARDLGAVRDLDVNIENLRGHMATLNVEQQRSLDPLLADWQARRAQAQRRLIEFLDGAVYDEWVARVEDFIEAKDKAGAPRVSDVVPALIWKHYGRVRAYESLVKQADLATLHALRIEGKRLRYVLEFFTEAMGSQVPALLEPLVALQDHLGALHDTDVASQLVMEFIAARARYAQRHGTAVPNFEGVAGYLSSLQARIGELQTNFIDRWHIIVRPPFRQALAEAVAAL